MILAGGVGHRAKTDIPKQFVKVLGKPILAYTLENFQGNENIDAIEIVCHKEWVDEVSRIVDVYGIKKTQWIATGGETFQESVMKGLFHLKGKINDEDIVVISFGVSPMTPKEDVDDSIRICQAHGNAISAADIDLCTCVKDDEFSSTQNIIRETLKGFANPWTFRFGEVCEVYEIALKQGILETVEPHTTSLYFELGKRVWFSKCSTSWVKITYHEDIDMFEAYLLLKKHRAILEKRNNQ